IVNHFRQDIVGYSKFDEVPYDFIRKRLSIVVAHENRHTMITKGALTSVVDICSRVQLAEEKTGAMEEYREKIRTLFESYSAQGFRVIGICCKDVTDDPVINKEDENNMTFLGFILLNDPPKEGIKTVIDDLAEKKVALKIITGDNRLIAGSIAAQLGIAVERIMSGRDLRLLDEDALAAKVEEISIFAETEPSQKERIVRALQRKGHVVGYLGDGINDASALKVADVGISVNNAVDVAKESADVILLEKNLEVISDGIIEGRKTYINTTKYILNSVCTNFGNMFSLAILSIVFPYLPLLPAQVLLINFLTDLPALAIVSDNVDSEFLERPRKWDIRLIRNFMIVFGLESSLFDFVTFGILTLLFRLPVAAVRTGWFVESVVSGVLILLVIRTHKLFFKSQPGKALLLASIFVMVAVITLPYLPVASRMDLSVLPVPVTFTMCLVALLYTMLGEASKRIIFRRMKY
ncbi:MAG: HAD-IC family P-type ATPase, partial [Bacteroidia bacterium]